VLVSVTRHRECGVGARRYCCQGQSGGRQSPLADPGIRGYIFSSHDPAGGPRDGTSAHTGNCNPATAVHPKTTDLLPRWIDFNAFHQTLISIAKESLNHQAMACGAQNPRGITRRSDPKQLRALDVEGRILAEIHVLRVVRPKLILNMDLIQIIPIHFNKLLNGSPDTDKDVDRAKQ